MFTGKHTTHAMLGTVVGNNCPQFLVTDEKCFLLLLFESSKRLDGGSILPFSSALNMWETQALLDSVVGYNCPQIFSIAIFVMKLFVAA
jgi:hypothetical protein